MARCLLCSSEATTWPLVPLHLKDAVAFGAKVDMQLQCRCRTVQFAVAQF